MESEILQALVQSGPAGVLALLLWIQTQRTEKRCDKREIDEAERNDKREGTLLERFDSDREAMRRILNLHQEQMIKISEGMDRMADKVHELGVGVAIQQRAEK